MEIWESVRSLTSPVRQRARVTNLCRFTAAIVDNWDECPLVRNHLEIEFSDNVPFKRMNIFHCSRWAVTTESLFECLDKHIPIRLEGCSGRKTFFNSDSQLWYSKRLGFFMYFSAFDFTAGFPFNKNVFPEMKVLARNCKQRHLWNKTKRMLWLVSGNFPTIYSTASPFLFFAFHCNIWPPT